MNFQKKNALLSRIPFRNGIISNHTLYRGYACEIVDIVLNEYRVVMNINGEVYLNISPNKVIPSLQTLTEKQNIIKELEFLKKNSRIFKETVQKDIEKLFKLLENKQEGILEILTTRGQLNNNDRVIQELFLNLLFEKIKIDFDNTQRQIDNNLKNQIEKEVQNIIYKFDKQIDRAKGLERSNLEKAKNKEINELSKRLRQYESIEKQFIEDEPYESRQQQLIEDQPFKYEYAPESVSKKARTELVSFNHMTHMSSMSVYIIENRVSPELKKMITILQLCDNDQDIPIFLNAHSVIIDNYIKQIETQQNGAFKGGETQIITLAYLFIYMNQLNININHTILSNIKLPTFYSNDNPEIIIKLMEIYDMIPKNSEATMIKHIKDVLKYLNLSIIRNKDISIYEEISFIKIGRRNKNIKPVTRASLQRNKRPFTNVSLQKFDSKDYIIYDAYVPLNIREPIKNLIINKIQDLSKLSNATDQQHLKNLVTNLNNSLKTNTLLKQRRFRQLAFPILNEYKHLLLDALSIAKKESLEQSIMSIQKQTQIYSIISGVKKNIKDTYRELLKTKTGKDKILYTSIYNNIDVLSTYTQDDLDDIKKEIDIYYMVNGDIKNEIQEFEKNYKNTALYTQILDYRTKKINDLRKTFGTKNLEKIAHLTINEITLKHHQASIVSAFVDAKNAAEIQLIKI